MNLVDKHIKSLTSIAPLAGFRILFGLIMFISIIRFISKGWILKQYVEPNYFFSFINVEWFTPLSQSGMHALFILMALAALFIMLGYFYKFAAILFFLAFTYVELLDKSNYLNHYYFVSIISFLLILVPANRYFSLDALRTPKLSLQKVPAWCINIFKLQLVIVYFYAGAAKLNNDWLFNALPLKIWLPAHSGLPIIGELLTQEWVAYAFSWTGAIYDLFIPFLLLYKRTRIMAFIAVVIFHALTRILFPIGMFPYIMILSTLIFFSAEWHERNFYALRKLFKNFSFLNLNKTVPPISIRTDATKATVKHLTVNNGSPAFQKAILSFLVIFFAFQLLMPWRYTLYNGNLFWTEQGYRFSWRVMLMEKAGHATFYVKNPATNKEAQVDIRNYLKPHQEKQMAFQPDMIIQFAHFLEKEYQKKGIEDPAIRVESYVTLNGRRSKLIIDPDIDLTEEDINLKQKKWVLPFAAIQ